MIFDFSYMMELVPALLWASLITLLATALGTVIAAILGLAFAILRRSRYQLVRYPVIAVVEFVRSTPLLVQLFFLFFVLPNFGLALPAFVTGVLALGLYYATYMSEVYRAGINAVPRGQWEAAHTLAMNRWQMWSRIIVPQAVPPIIPILCNYVIAMFKDTPLFAMIGIVELLGSALTEAGRTYRYYEPLTLVGIIFLLYSVIASFCVKKLEAAIASRT